MKKGGTMLAKKSDLYVITSAKKLVGYILTLTEKCPKKFRYSYLSRIENDCLSLISFLYEANDTRLENPIRLDRQNMAMTRLKVIDFMSEEAMNHKCFTMHQYEVISNFLEDTRKSLDGWIASDMKRLRK